MNKTVKFGVLYVPPKWRFLARCRRKNIQKKLPLKICIVIENYANRQCNKLNLNMYFECFLPTSLKEDVPCYGSKIA